MLPHKYFNSQSQKPIQAIHKHTQTHTHTRKHIHALTHLYSGNGLLTVFLLYILFIKCLSSTLVINTHNKKKPRQPNHYWPTLCGLTLSSLLCGLVTWFLFQIEKDTDTKGLFVTSFMFLIKKHTGTKGLFPRQAKYVYIYKQICTNIHYIFVYFEIQKYSKSSHGKMLAYVQKY